MIIITVSLTIPGIPVPKGRPRFAVHGGYVRTYTPQKTRDYENTIRTLFLAKYGDNSKPIFPANQPLCIEVQCFFPVPKSASKRVQADMLSGITMMTKRPDIDNLQKCWDALIQDKQNGIGYAMADDAQVVEVHAYKLYSEDPRTEIIIKPIEGNEEIA